MPIGRLILPKNKGIMERMEKKISRSDKIFATLTHNGTRLADIDGSNFGSIADVVKRIFTATGQWIGIAVLTIRNYNQGWRIDLPLSFKPTRRTSATIPPHDGRQYTLPLFS